MNTKCHICNREFELTDSNTSIAVINQHPSVQFLVTVECPHCDNTECTYTRSLSTFTTKPLEQTQKETNNNARSRAMDKIRQ